MNWLKKIWKFIFNRKINALEIMLRAKIDEVEKMRVEFENKAPVVYTTIRSYNSENGDKVFWPWVRSVLVSDEYRYLIFTLRENVIRELTQTSDITSIHEANGQLKMLQMLDTFLTRGLKQYDAERKNPLP
jgi:hypothetical protein